ncbi:three component ABC system middle component [Paenibacillus radicis (ex Xue et al. 2023)]|uniref:DUF6521 family protein n=1 Tax=Paenibacillus radicis (ex Xue et al. 2023) TaxID=2972489 RepID=A0ABT1YBZ9_9BACL|nr:three component ABC system middle component [Paenibacillus radicis (ex Xue et al. 2023)]MCR8630713.1 DUF6521 family protein [Paenibacillus radicis (ex Xue et al. 2023)]
MGVLDREINLIQNAALGATLLWRFVSGFSNGSETKESTPIPLLYIVLPMIYHHETLDLISTTQKPSGLRMFADKFYISKNSMSDILLTIHQRAIDFKEVTTESMRLALSSRLIAFNIEKGAVIPLSKAAPKLGIPDSIKEMHKAAEKLGFWCSQLTIHEVSTILKVGF